MANGQPDKQQAYDIATLEMDPDFDPKVFSEEAKTLIQALLNRSPKQRLGAKGAEQVKNMPFFASIDWAKIEMRQVPSKFQPGKHINAASQADIGSFNLSETKNVTWDETDEAIYSGWNFVSGNAFQEEVVQFMEWELKQGPITVSKESSLCCTVL